MCLLTRSRVSTLLVAATPAAVDARVAEASAAGITDLLVQVRGRGEALAGWSRAGDPRR